MLDALRQILETEVSSTLSPAYDDLMEDSAPEPEGLEASGVFAEAEQPEELATPVVSQEPAVAAPVARAVAPALSVVKRDAASLVGTDVDDDIDVVDVIDPDLFPIFGKRLPNCCPNWVAHCASGQLVRTIWVPAAKSCVPCTPSKAARVWQAPCAWVKWRTASSLPLSRSTWRRSPSTKWNLCF